jgi:hypothetical protein
MADPLTVEAIAQACKGRSGIAQTVVTALLPSLAVAFVSWLMNRAQAKEIEKLRSSLALATGRDLAAHQSGLREHAELRLKFNSAAIDAIGQTSRDLGAIPLHFLKTITGNPLPDGDLFMAPLASGVLLPPSLDAPLDEVLEAAGKMAQALARAPKDDPHGVAQDCVDRLFAPAFQSFILPARAWKTSVLAEEKQQ